MACGPGWDTTVSTSGSSSSSTLRDGSGSNLTVLENTGAELLDDDGDVVGLGVGADVTLVNVDHQGALVVCSSFFSGSSFSFVKVRLQIIG